MLRAKLSIARELMRFGIEVRAIIYADKELHRRYGYEIHSHFPCSTLRRFEPTWTFDQALKVAAGLFLS
jgi:hypothetical protein